MATHSSPLAWKIPWTEEPSRGGPSRGARGVTKSQTGLSNFTFFFSHFLLLEGPY